MNNAIEPWMRGIVNGADPVKGQLERAVEQILEDAAETLVALNPSQIWTAKHGLTSVGFHAKHLAGSTERLSVYLAGGQLSPEQLSAIDAEGTGTEDAQALLVLMFDEYLQIVRRLPVKDFGAVREIGRKKYQASAIGLAMHVVEHGQRHIGGMIAAAKAARFSPPTMKFGFGPAN